MKARHSRFGNRMIAASRERSGGRTVVNHRIIGIAFPDCFRRRLATGSSSIGERHEPMALQMRLARHRIGQHHVSTIERSFLSQAARRTSRNIARCKAVSVAVSIAASWRHSAVCTWQSLLTVARDHGACVNGCLSPWSSSAATIARYLSDEAGTFKPATLQRRLSSISQAHQMAGYASPTTNVAVRTVWADTRRVHGTIQVGNAPAVVADIRAMVAALPARDSGVRDRALLLLGFAGAIRRSELVTLNVDDVVENRDGLVVTLRKSKTDQEGAGRAIGIPFGAKPATCGVRAVRDWLAIRQDITPALFYAIDRHDRHQAARMCDRSVARIVKRSAVAAGLDAARYSGHSLRAGLATSAAAAGISERAITAQTGQRSMTILRRFIREGSLFRENAAAGIGL